MIVQTRWIRTKKYKQANAANVLGVGRPEISDLQRGKVQKFSIDKLVTMLQKAREKATTNVADRMQHKRRGRKTDATRNTDAYKR